MNRIVREIYLLRDRIKDKIRKIKEYQEEKKWQFVKSALLATHV